MADVLRQLSSILVLGALVGIFVSLQRKNRSPRVWYWVIAWGLMFLHFFVSLLRFTPGLRRLEIFLELATLQLAGAAFLISVSGFLYRRLRKAALVAAFAIPVLAYSALMAFDVSNPWPYVACLAPFFYGGAAWGISRRRSLWFSAVVPAGVLLFGSWDIYRVLRGDVAAGFYGLLLVIYLLAGVLFTLRYRRPSPGVLVTVGGFLSWAGVWALNLWAQPWMHATSQQNELWNVPKYFVAFGMIVVLLEEQTIAARAAGEREHAANVQLQQFAQVTSHLLSGVDAKSYCDTIARVITAATTFDRVVIALVDDDQRLFVAGHDGLSESALAAVREKTGAMSARVADELCRRGRPIGASAVILEPDAVEPYTVRTERRYEPNPYWKAGDELYVPMHSPRGAFVGLISLDDPRQPERVDAAEMSKIEMLAADIAVAIDNAAMQKRLLLSEKLAGVGQLVSGVAHELNNPLTAVLGYAELLSDRAQDDDMRHGLSTIYREGQRIKAIIGNLVRFAQHDPAEHRPVDVLPLLQQLMRQKTYEARSRGIELLEDFSSMLPRVTADENQLKQVLLNVLNNALEAVENAPERRITVVARTEANRVVLSFMDTGPGFTDVNRVFDPFFTTKKPGKGTGLGLSICYGILKQHGGSIVARNISPAGACVTLELPVAKVQAAGTAS